MADAPQLPPFDLADLWPPDPPPMDLLRLWDLIDVGLGTSRYLPPKPPTISAFATIIDSSRLP